jgi:hypothetical protein
LKNDPPSPIPLFKKKEEEEEGEKKKKNLHGNLSQTFQFGHHWTTMMTF